MSALCLCTYINTVYIYTHTHTHTHARAHAQRLYQQEFAILGRMFLSLIDIDKTKIHLSEVEWLWR